jgi:putative transposase
VGALLVEVSDELIAAPRRYMAEVTLTTLIDQEDRLPSLPAAPRH